MTRREQRDYVHEEADIYGVPFRIALALFDLLGENEMFSGFINALEDIEYDGYEF